MNHSGIFFSLPVRLTFGNTGTVLRGTTVRKVLFLHLDNKPAREYVLQSYNHGNSPVCTYKEANARYTGSIGPGVLIIKAEKTGPDGRLSNDRLACIMLKNTDCGQIKGKYLGTDMSKGVDYILLEEMDGDVGKIDFIKQFSSYTNIDSKLAPIFVVEVMRRQLMCMLENKIYYSDVKPANFLYKRVGQQCQFKFGDLGSIVPDNGKHAYTYPCAAERGVVTGWMPKPDASCILRMLGMMLCFLYGMDDGSFVWDSDERKRQEFEDIVRRGKQYLHRHLPSRYQFLVNLLDDHDQGSHASSIVLEEDMKMFESCVYKQPASPAEPTTPRQGSPRN